MERRKERRRARGFSSVRAVLLQGTAGQGGEMFRVLGSGGSCTEAISVNKLAGYFLVIEGTRRERTQKE